MMDCEYLRSPWRKWLSKHENKYTGSMKACLPVYVFFSTKSPLKKTYCFLIFRTKPGFVQAKDISQRETTCDIFMS
jgi:hypothetical protein